MAMEVIGNRNIEKIIKKESGIMELTLRQMDRSGTGLRIWGPDCLKSAALQKTTLVQELMAILVSIDSRTGVVIVCYSLASGKTKMHGICFVAIGKRAALHVLTDDSRYWEMEHSRHQTRDKVRG
jgi:hypothetical protein